MLLDEFFPDASSIRSEESKDRSSVRYQDNGESNKEKFSDSDDGTKSICIESSADFTKVFDGDKIFSTEYKCMTKTELPEELQELVKEALAELKLTESLST